jgi:general secretion pathway protein N
MPDPTQGQTADRAVGQTADQAGSPARGRARGLRRGTAARAPAAADTARWQRALRASRRWALWGAALGVVAGTAVQAPAQWLAAGLQSATGGRLLLAEARGSMWNGSAVLVLTGGPGSRDAAALPGRLQWQLRPAWTGLHLVARHDCCLPTDGLRLQVSAGPGGLRLAPVDAPAAAGAGGAAPPPGGPRLLGHWPAGWLAGLGTPWNTLQLGGQLQLSTSGFQLQTVAGQWRLAGDLLLRLQGASSRLSSLPVLGSYQLLLQGSGRGDEATQLRLTSQDGALRLQGEGQWTGARLRFRGTAQAADGQDGALANLLNIIGRRQGALSVISIG